VTFYGANENLHAVWDTGLIRKRAPFGWEVLAVELANEIETQQTEAWKQNLDPVEWGDESLEITKGLYPPEHTLGEAYYDDHIEIVEDRLKAAGVRLGALLNKTLGGAEVTAAP
jgi:hypothetical protein